jgi:hypothetical protein
MKTTLIAIENDADHVQAKALVGKLMGSRRSDDWVRLVAQARLIEAYQERWLHLVRSIYWRLKRRLHVGKLLGKLAPELVTSKKRVDVTALRIDLSLCFDDEPRPLTDYSMEILPPASSPHSRRIHGDKSRPLSRGQP